MSRDPVPTPGHLNSRFTLDPAQGRLVWWLTEDELSRNSRPSAPLNATHSPAATASAARDGSPTPAFLEFAWLDATTLDVFHTEVPAAWRGRGLGRALVLNGLPALARLQAHSVVLSCSYLQHLDDSGALEALKPHLPYHLKRPA